MRLNPDCVRDILLTVEENTTFSRRFDLDGTSEYSRLSPYDDETLLYHIRQCKLSGLLTGVQWYLDESVSIDDLSPLGHSFLADIRADTNWSKVKNTASKVGSFSIDTLTKIASAVISTVISDVLRGTP